MDTPLSDTLHEVNHGKTSISDETDPPRHSQAYKDEALALAERIGVREQSLADENVRLKRLLAEQAPVIAT